MIHVTPTKGSAQASLIQTVNAPGRVLYICVLTVAETSTKLDPSCWRLEAWNVNL